MLQGQKNCVKFLLCFYTVTYMLSGIAFIAIGTAALTSGEFQTEFLGQKFHRAPHLLLFIGCFVFVVALVGCCGAVKENYIMITLFSVFLMTVLLIEISGVILAYVFRGELDFVVKKNMLKSIEQNNKVTNKVWDDMQTEWKCCGVYGASDYNARPEPKIPKSCCRSNVTMDGCFQSSAYQVGCHDRLVGMLKKKFTFIGTAGLVGAALEMIGLFFAFWLASTIKKERDVV